MTFLQCCGADLFRTLAALSSRHSEIVLSACCNRDEHQPAAIRCRAPAALLDVAKDFVSLEAIQRQLSRMMTGPIAISFASAIDHQLADAMCLEVTRW